MKSQKVSVFLYSAAGLAVFILCWHLSLIPGLLLKTMETVAGETFIN